MIGPNAILQLLSPIERAGGHALCEHVLACAEISAIPDGSEMIPEGDATRLHQAVRQLLPADEANVVLAEAGRGTADYVLEHRIPKLAQWILKLLPAGPAAQLLSTAIAQNAWTFAGSGTFVVQSPWVFEVADNPLIAQERSVEPLCTWHAAVFERLYQVLVSPDCRCVETHCQSQEGVDRCRFELRR